jgi:hypothetical protein
MGNIPFLPQITLVSPGSVRHPHGTTVSVTPTLTRSPGNWARNEAHLVNLLMGLQQNAKMTTSRAFKKLHVLGLTDLLLFGNDTLASGALILVVWNREGSRLLSNRKCAGL